MYLETRCKSSMHLILKYSREPGAENRAFRGRAAALARQPTVGLVWLAVAA
jgi:hypothetical protein